MATNPVPIEVGKWTLVYTGPTTRQISVENPHSYPTIWIAAAADIPTFPGPQGHVLKAGVVKLVELDDGENLYAWLSDGQLNTITITD